MSIVVASENPLLVESLRTFLAHSGLSPVYECRTLHTFRSALKQSKTPPRVILVDGDLSPHERAPIRTHLGSEESLALTVRGWIDPSASPLWQVSPKDFHFAVNRPFDEDAFFSALFLGGENERREKNRWVYIGAPDHALRSRLQQARIQIIPNAKSEPMSELRPGVLIIDSRCLDENDVAALKRFRRSPEGAQTLFASLSQDPVRIHKIRTLCHLFLEEPTSESSWHSTVEFLKSRFQKSLRTEVQLLRLRQSLKSQQNKNASRILKDLQRHCGDFLETHIASARMEINLGRPRRAMRFYQKALRLDPCNPEIYAQLMKLVPGDAPLGQEVRKKARLYCPNCKELFQSDPHAAAPRTPSAELQAFFGEGR